MTESSTVELPNKVEISDAGPCRKRIAIEIPAQTVTQTIRGSMDTLAVDADVPGFRRGRAPRRLIEKRFGGAVREDARKRLITGAYAKAVEEHKLRVVAEPTAEQLSGVELAEGRPLKFEIEVEVTPEFPMPAIDGIPVRRPIIEVTDGMVDEELNKLCVNEGSLEPRERPEAGDYLTGHGIMTGPDGKEYYNIKGAVVQVPPADRGGKGMILGVMVEDFARQLGLPEPGRTATVKVKGPSNHEVEALRDKDLTVTFQVDRVDRIIPAPAADIVARLGFPAEAELREAIRQRLQQRVAIQQQSIMRQQVAMHLIRGTSFDLPRQLTAMQSQRLLDRNRMELMYRGVRPQEIEEHMAELRNASSVQAQRELQLFFIVQRVAEELKISVDDAELNQRVAMMAMERGVRPEKLRQEIIQSNRVGMLYQQVREHKTMDAILGRATITDLPVDEFNKAMEAEAKARG